MSLDSKEAAMEAFERARAEFLDAARAVLSQKPIGARMTVDDVRAVVPIPDGIDGRVMGAVFNQEGWQADGYANSKRRECHGRPIRVFLKTK